MTSDLLATISLDGRFTLLNPAWEQLLGWTREELQSRARSQDFMHPDDVEQTLALILGREQDSPAERSRTFTNRYRHRGRLMALAAVERPPRRRHLVRGGQGRDRPACGSSARRCTTR